MYICAQTLVPPFTVRGGSDFLLVIHEADVHGTPVELRTAEISDKDMCALSHTRMG